MTKPIIREHNLETNEIIDREMTNAEFEAWDNGNKAKAAKDEAEITKKATAQAKLAALGLTVEDLQALGL